MKINLQKSSSRHHYNPIFYIKGFLNDKHHLYVFDKESLEIKRKEVYPKQIFFEWNDNSSMLKNIEVDFAEQVYKFVDDKHANLIQAINKSNPSQSLFTENTVGFFNQFIAFLFWRNPTNAPLVNQILSKNDFQELNLVAVDNKTGKIINNKNRKKIIFSDETFRKLSKTHLPFSSQAETNKLKDKINPKILYFKSDKVLISDNPIIHRNEVKSVGDVLEDFIIPISSNKLVFCSKSSKNKISDYFLTYHNLLSIHQANQYVASGNRDYLIEIQEAYRKLSSKGKSNLKNQLFELITNN